MKPLNAGIHEFEMRSRSCPRGIAQSQNESLGTENNSVACAVGRRLSWGQDKDTLMNGAGGTRTRHFRLWVDVQL